MRGECAEFHVFNGVRDSQLGKGGSLGGGGGEKLLPVDQLFVEGSGKLVEREREGLVGYVVVGTDVGCEAGVGGRQGLSDLYIYT